MSKIRTFVAIPVCNIPVLETWLNHLKKIGHYDKIKWSESGFWHLTLKFIGNVDEAELELLRGALRRILVDHHVGDLVFRGSGFFSSAENPKVVWAGVEMSDWLIELKGKVEQAASVLNLPTDGRPYHPHLTLGRINFLKRNSPLKEAVKREEETVWGKQKADRVILYKSTLNQNGPVYSEIERYFFIDP